MSLILDRAVIAAVDELGYAYFVDHEYGMATVPLGSRRLPFDLRIRTNNSPVCAIIGSEFPSRVPRSQRRVVSRLLDSKPDRVYQIDWAMEFGMVRAILRVNLDNAKRPDVRIKHAVKRFRAAVERMFLAIATAVSPRHYWRRIAVVSACRWRRLEKKGAMRIEATRTVVGRCPPLRGSKVACLRRTGVQCIP